MTTTERGLFEKISEHTGEERCRDDGTYFNAICLHEIEGICAEFEQRLAEAENYIGRLPANWDRDSSLETWFPFTAEKIKRDEETIAQLRARCWELEQLVAAKDEALRPFAELGQWLFARPNIPDETRAVEFPGISGYIVSLTRGHFKAAHTALTATQQPAQEQITK